MINWARVIGFDWDEGNSRKSKEKHSVSQSEAESIFFNEPILVLEDAKHSQSEARFHALSETDDAQPLHITFTLREDGTLIRVIFARVMHRKERAIYEQAKKDS
ncbi:BrnT family toxin [Halomonas sp. MA07-2]|uniref:BrnT family toxin n=1 Tax=unclassified Halomonas TaxID=2609666 RepID=UPI003EEAEC93